jgi:hypothetical protein
MPGAAEVDRYQTDSGLGVRPDKHKRRPDPQFYVSNGSDFAQTWVTPMEPT